MKKLLVTSALMTLISTTSALDLELYNEANGYWGTDALSLAEALRDQNIAGYLDRQSIHRSALEDYNEANGYAGADSLSQAEMLHDRSIGGHRQYDIGHQVFTLRGTLDRDSAADKVAGSSPAASSPDGQFN